MSAIRKVGSISQLWRVIIFLCCALTAATTQAASAEPQGGIPSAAAEWNARFAIGDFDGDNQPDLATVQNGPDRSGTRYWIRLEFGTGLRDAIGVIAPSGGLHITSRDVNGDHFLDLVVSTAWQHRPVAVLLNDGHGKFTLRDPALFASAVLDCELSWAPAWHDVKDGVAAILTRTYSGTCDADNLASPAHISRTLLAIENSRESRCSANGLVFGRAPPSILHV